MNRPPPVSTPPDTLFPYTPLFRSEDSDAVLWQVMEVVRRAFRPEFLNRLDEVLLFHRLTRPQMTGIVDIQLRRLHAMLADRKIALELDDQAKVWLADTGYEDRKSTRLNSSH